MTENDNEQLHERTLHRPVKTVVVPAEEQHLDAVRRLWLTRFGADEEIMDKWLADSLSEDRPEETFVALEAGNVLGFGVCSLAEPDYARDYIGLDVDGFEPWSPTGVLHMAAVKQGRESEGIGSKLFAERVQYLANIGAEGIMAVSWHRDGHDSRDLFEKYHFDRVARFERYYARSHGRPDCPDCGGECECTASIYAREIA
jgi:ribosomal protein S18 acetylase RimI-like enzyme